jgi:hypothetical protein
MILLVRKQRDRYDIEQPRFKREICSFILSFIIIIIRQEANILPNIVAGQLDKNSMLNFLVLINLSCTKCECYDHSN